MIKILRNTLALVAGFVIGGIVNMAIIVAGPILIPLPDGVDMSDMEKFGDNLKLFKPANFIAPWLAHSLGTLVGAFVAAKLASSHKLTYAVGIGVFFLLGGITMVSKYGGPVWFIAIDLIGAYLPMGYFGGMLAGAAKSKQNQSPNAEKISHLS